MSLRVSSSERWLLGLIVVFAIAPYLPSLGGSFVFDDQLQIVENDLIRDLRNFPRFFTEDVWAAIGIPYSSYYRPLMYTTYAIEFAIAGPEPWIFRLTNVLLHAGICVSLYTLVRRSGGTLAAAAISGLLFAVHPMHAEVVAWPAARPELLVTLFALLAAVVHLGAPVEQGPARGRFLAVGALVMLALLSKETGIVVPALIVVGVLLRSPESNGFARARQALLAALPYATLILVFFGIRGFAIRVEGTPPLVGDDPLRFPYSNWPDAIRSVLAIAGRYLGLMLVPFESTFFRVPSWEHVRWGLFFTPLGIASVIAAPWSRAAAWLAFAFVAIGVQSLGIPSAGYLSQRYSYLPSVGACAAIAEVIAALAFAPAAAAPRRAVGLGVVVAIVVAWTALLLPRAHEWTDEPLLWTRAYSRDLDSPAVLMNYGYILVDSGRAEEAIPLFQRVGELETGGWAASHGEANALVALGRYEEAIPLYRRAIERAPMIPQLHQALAAAYEELGDLENARATYSKAHELFPDSAISQGMIGTVLLKEGGNDQEALDWIDDALAIRPDRPELRINRVIVLARLGRIDEAIADSQKLIEDPVLAPEAHRNLGIIYERYRPDRDRAIVHYTDAIRLAPQRPDAAQIQQRIEALRTVKDPSP